MYHLWICLSSIFHQLLNIYTKKGKRIMVGHLTKFDQIIEKVLEHEGGYVNDPDDPGGETKYGISKKAYPDLDIASITKMEAKEIYKKDYWNKNRVGEVPSRLKYIYFDMCVNMGRSRAVKILQNAANSKNSHKIDVDGGMGPMTISAISSVEPDRVRSYRVLYYGDLVNRKPDLEKYWYGWFRRSIQV